MRDSRLTGHPFPKGFMGSNPISALYFESGVERVNYIGLETLTNIDVIRLGSHDG